MKKITLKLTIFLLLFISSFGVNSQINFSSSSVKEILKKALKENKNVFIYVTNNSNSCWWIENEVFNNTEVGNFYNKNFLCLKIINNIESEDFESEDITINKYPYLIYYEPNTGTGFNSSGERNIEQIMKMAKFAANEFKYRKTGIHNLKEIGVEYENSVYKIPKNDGRYSLGVNGKRLMYGYPYPTSTSHFIVSANNKVASNSSRFLNSEDLQYREYIGIGKKNVLKRLIYPFRKKKKKKFKVRTFKNVEYLIDTLSVSFVNNNAMRSEIDFNFNGLEIKQELIPLNKNLQICSQNDTTKYYRIEYTLENKTDTIIKAGLVVLFDMMIDNNDGAEMDVFKGTIGKKPKKTASFGYNKGLNSKYLKEDKIKQILVYKNNLFSKGMTGIFRIETEPDEIHVGSWPDYYSSLWHISKKILNKKYYDSAVLLKWDNENLPAYQKKTISVIFGIHSKGMLDLVPAGTKYTGVDSLGKRKLNPEITLTLKKGKVFSGEPDTLSWEVLNSENFDIYLNSGEKRFVQKKGSCVVRPVKNEKYYISVLDGGKLITKKEISITVLETRKKVKIDGRFTIGSEKTPVFFGYPFPYSTSFFTLKTGEQTFSNSATYKNSTFIQPEQFIDADSQEKNSIIYNFNDFKITQKLIPCNENQQAVNIDNAVFIRCEYIVKNISKKTCDISFSQFLDLPANINNDSYIFSNNKKTNINNVFLLKEVPEKFSIINSKNETNALIIPKIKDYPAPVFAATGEKYLIENLELDKITNEKIYSNNISLLLNWKKEIAPDDSISFAFYVSSNGKEKLNYKYSNYKYINELTINFDSGKDIIDTTGIKKINKFIEENSFDFLILEGYTDNKGDNSSNYTLSSNRVMEVEKIIIQKSETNKTKILKKINGEFYSNITNNAVETADINFRKVTITLFRSSE